mgnify:CR=1 FL=1
MRINSEEIITLLSKQIEEYSSQINVSETGTVIQAGDGVVKLYGLANAILGELLLFPNDVYGIALNLEEETIGAILLGSDRLIKEGDPVKCTGRVVEVPVGGELLGRVVNAMGIAIDGKAKIQAKQTAPIEKIAPGVVLRQPVKEPLQTGIKVIDSMIPIGKGQCELIIGDRHTGKTAIAIDTIINQKGKDVKCIYVAIGQKKSTVAQIFDILGKYGAMEYTTIIAATAGDPAPMQYIAAYAGCAMGEYYRDSGQHALIIYDDLTKHAAAYRQVSLLLRRPSGREAFPGDIFYAHSRLLERTAKLSDEFKGGSLTALPIIETQAGDISAYIPSNVISMTDGQIYLEKDLFNSGIKPAINAGLSVSCVGGNTQVKAMKQAVGSLRLGLAQYREVEAFAQFGADLDKTTQAQITRGERLVELLKQGQYEPIDVSAQIALIFAGTRGYLDEINVSDVRQFCLNFIKKLEEKHKPLLDKIENEKQLSESIEKELAAVINDTKTMFAL